jgi:hypothetical protein
MAWCADSPDEELMPTIRPAAPLAAQPEAAYGLKWQPAALLRLIDTLAPKQSRLPLARWRRPWC